MNRKDDDLSGIVGLWSLLPFKKTGLDSFTRKKIGLDFFQNKRTSGIRWKESNERISEIRWKRCSNQEDSRIW